LSFNLLSVTFYKNSYMHSCLDTYGTLISLTFIFNDNSCKILYTDNIVRLEESATESNSFYTHMLFSFVHSYRA